MDSFDLPPALDEWALAAKPLCASRQAQGPDKVSTAGKAQRRKSTILDFMNPRSSKKLGATPTMHSAPQKRSCPLSPKLEVEEWKGQSSNPLSPPPQLQEHSSPPSKKERTLPAAAFTATEAKGALLPQTPHQPSQFCLPKRDFGRKNVVKRALQSGWFKQWPWLHYC